MIILISFRNIELISDMYLATSAALDLSGKELKLAMPRATPSTRPIIT